jgi:hypothetical protein
MIVEVAADNGPQPPPELVHWLVPASPKFLLELFQLCGESLRDGLALDIHDSMPVYPGALNNLLSLFEAFAFDDRDMAIGGEILEGFYFAAG